MILTKERKYALDKIDEPYGLQPWDWDNHLCYNVLALKGRNTMKPLTFIVQDTFGDRGNEDNAYVISKMQLYG